MPAKPKASSPSRQFGRGQEPDPCTQLLIWRLYLAGFLTLVAGISYLLIPEKLIIPGLISSLGLLFTTLAGGWAATMAGISRKFLLSAQIAADTLIIALLVHYSGGPYSAIPLVFSVPIVFGAYFIGRYGAMVTAAVAAITTGGGHFGLALGWMLFGITTRAEYLQGWPVLVTATHMSIFLVVGMISGDLADRLALRQRIQLRNILQVRKARSEVRNILDNIQSGLLSIDRQGIINRVNPSCCRILQVEPSDLMGRPLTEIMSGELQDLGDVILPVASGGIPVERGEVVVYRQGRKMPLGLNVNHAKAPSGKIVGAIAIFTDLTREKEMTSRMREADRLAAVGELAASIAHEIRNPLASIRGSVEMLQDELELEGYQEQLFSLVLKESSRVNTIINDFLAYSRMRPASLKRFSGADFLAEFQLQMHQHIATKGGSVRVRFDAHPAELMVVADSEQLTQMTLNLGINACEAMNYQGELIIALSQVEGGQTLELLVTDSGPGIDDEIREHLFSPFKTTKERGTGLGLSTVARIAASHGGSARAEDAPGGGSTFRIRWPLPRNLDIPTISIGLEKDQETQQEALLLT